MSKLEALHKCSLIVQSAQDNKALKQLLEYNAKCILFLGKKIYYESGDKSGIYLARALKDPKLTQNISSIRNREGKLSTTEKIAQRFNNFYTKLYNYPPQHKPSGTHGRRMQIINDYLTQSALPTLSKTSIDNLERPIDVTELLCAIKDLKPGKSPGPDGFSSIYYKTFGGLQAEPF